ncbi:MAG: hypothetical protein HYU77_00330 [Betaproteobacteria bacterium]|nr:hypothetical protein [Betaproteobacteria bacterium]
MSTETPAPRIILARWATHSAAEPGELVFIPESGGAAPQPADACVILPAQGAERARALLAQGVRQVLLGEAALLDSAQLDQLAREFGPARIGLYVPSKRMQVSWSMDVVSNADFRFVTPSLCEPSWEVLRADGSRTGTIVDWWIGAMFDLGASSALVRVDLEDDNDLNICARLTERFGDRLWLAAAEGAAPAFDQWVEYGKAMRLVVSDEQYQENPAILALRGVPGPDQQQVA